LIRGQYAARVLRCYEAGRDVFPDYDNYASYMRAEFEQARSLNPEDKNAAVLWQHNLAAQEIRTANSYVMRGQRREALEHYARAVRMAPDSYIRAGARYLYEQAAAGPPR
jgi:tetratricopeptide (TPR) repeat protein